MTTVTGQFSLNETDGDVITNILNNFQIPKSNITDIYKGEKTLSQDEHNVGEMTHWKNLFRTGGSTYKSKMIVIWVTEVDKKVRIRITDNVGTEITDDLIADPIVVLTQDDIEGIDVINLDSNDSNVTVNYAIYEMRSTT